jgi:DNA-binding GntR family transcriptional regulator
VHVQTPDPQVVIRQAGVLLQLTGASLKDVYFARAAMEASSVRALTLRRTDADLTALRELVAEGHACLGGSIEDFGAVAGRFHRALVYLSASITMSFLVDLLATLTDATYSGQVANLRPGPREERVKRALRSWEKLIGLIEAGDADAAEQHWLQHLNTVGANLPGDARPLAAEVLPGVAKERDALRLG